MITRRNLLLSAAALAATSPLGARIAWAEGATLRFGPQLDPGTLDTLTNVYDYPYPPFSTISGRIPKKAGRHKTRSAHLPTSTEPISWLMPCAIAGLIVYFAM